MFFCTGSSSGHQPDHSPKKHMSWKGVLRKAYEASLKLSACPPESVRQKVSKAGTLWNLFVRCRRPTFNVWICMRFQISTFHFKCARCLISCHILGTHLKINTHKKRKRRGEGKKKNYKAHSLFIFYLDIISHHRAQGAEKLIWSGFFKKFHE